MYIARILYPVHVLGPGERVAIWVCGCNKNCQGCANPELQKIDEKYFLTLDKVIYIINNLPKHNVGFTITGGEPFDQSKEIYELVSYISTFTDDILVYSGYTYNELLKSNDNYIHEILNKIAALVDGRYIDELNTGNRIKGSDNQQLYVFNSKYEKIYRQLDCACDKRNVENFICESGDIITVGFQKRNFKSEYQNLLKSKLNKSGDDIVE